MQIKKTIFIAGLLGLATSLTAQNGTSSPYSRFGLGLMQNQSFGRADAMGGSGIALRSGQMLNVANPASFNAVDSLSMIFEFGASGKFTRLSESGQSANFGAGNFDYLGMNFRITPRLGAAFGLVPVSVVGYDYNKNFDLPGAGNTYNVKYNGQGGLNQTFGGLSYAINKHLSVGASVSYVFGNINQQMNETFYDGTNGLIVKTDYSASAFLPQIGVQYKYPMGKNQISFGATYQPKVNLGFKVDSTVYTTDNTSLKSVSSVPVLTELAGQYALGVAYQYGDKLIAALDFSAQNWDKTKFLGVGDSLMSTYKVKAGIEYTPSQYGRYFVSRVHYRLGGNYGTSNFSIAGKQIKNYGITFGVGLPMRYNKTLFNIAVETGKMGFDSGEMLKENYTRISINLAINEFWFFKRKFE